MTENLSTFKAYLAQFRKEQSPIGDLARDVAEDSRFPDHGRQAMKDHLDDMGACDAAMDVFEWAYERYENEVQA